ncbi:MAG: hypothetical protein MUE56_04910 [Ignavibacteria bacterium]|nr:hypothetical protein [Ignavibacteria bacterium]
MLNKRLINILCFTKIFAILFLFLGHNFIHHDHDETHSSSYKCHTEENHQDEHNEDDMTLNSHLHMFYTNSSGRNLINISVNFVKEFAVVNSLIIIDSTENKFTGIYHKSDNLKLRYFSSILKDRAPPIS